MARRVLATALVCASACTSLLCDEQPARAQAAPAPPTPAGPVATTTASAPGDAFTGHVQYGASLAIEILNSAGQACPVAATAPCVLGSGGGLSLRLGFRFPAPFYLGAAYELSKVDANNLLRLPILQQVRGELRYLPYATKATAPFVVAGAGAAAYGSEWGASTVGPLGMLGFGLQIQLSATSIFTAQAAYRAMRFAPWIDPSGQARDASLASFVGFELGFEQQ